MAKGINAQPHRGDFWSRRCNQSAAKNRYGKKLTHRYERRQAKDSIREELNLDSNENRVKQSRT